MKTTAEQFQPQRVLIDGLEVTVIDGDMNRSFSSYFPASAVQRENNLPSDTSNPEIFL